MLQIVLMFHVLIALSIIALVLLQQGKGASMGAAFGSGASNTLFGSRGPASFLMKLTGGLVLLFFVTSITLGHLAAVQARVQNQLSVPKMEGGLS
ncbi:MAG: preprotein translocase subunit SecG [Gammaproteobacteria bacterium]|nr:preprotein translocase subunit SecG [Gammaproteobacteria bacterium]